jgi:lipid-A-disaccharide synthase
MMAQRPLRIAIVAGEESGDLLGADLATALADLSGHEASLSGVGGRHLRALGLDPLFDGSEIALMGVSAVLKDLPRLMRRIGQTADAVVRANPDCLVTIDSPDFSLRVARKVRAADPSIPIVHYVCPSVWAWRPSRAAAMRPYVDEILCVLPFEPEALKRLDGPHGTYVGHRLTTHSGIEDALATQVARASQDHADTARRLLVLPGSRRSEVTRLMEPFGEIVDILHARGNRLDIAIPTVPHVAALVEAACDSWQVRPRIIHDERGKWQAFGEADAALAASGTVLLELALAGVPTVSCYRTDRVFGPIIKRLVTTWSAALPNLVADWPVVPEYLDENIRPGLIARQLEQLIGDTHARASQMAGFAQVAAAMATERPAGQLAAEAVLRLTRGKLS